MKRCIKLPQEGTIKKVQLTRINKVKKKLKFF